MVPFAAPAGGLQETPLDSLMHLYSSGDVIFQQCLSHLIATGSSHDYASSLRTGASLAAREGHGVSCHATTDDVAAPSHSTTEPSVTFALEDVAVPELGEALEGVLAYLEDFGQVGGHLASLMALVDEE